MGKNSKGINLTFLIIILLIGVAIWVSCITVKEDAYTRGEFVRELEAGNVVSVEIEPNAQVPTGTVYITLRDSAQAKKLYVSDVVEIQELLTKYNIDPLIHDIPKENWFLTDFLPLLLLIVVMVFLFSMMTTQNSGGNGGKMMNFGKSHARLSTGGEVTLKDVAGLKEEKEELEEIVVSRWPWSPPGDLSYLPVTPFQSS